MIEVDLFLEYINHMDITCIRTLYVVHTHIYIYIYIYIETI